MNDSENKILIAVIGKAQGIKGHMRLKNFSSAPESLADYDVFWDKAGQKLQVKDFYLHKDMPIIAFDEVRDRTQAEQMAGRELFILREQLAEDLEEDEFYQTDLLDYLVYDEDNIYIGKVSGFFNFGGGDLLEINLPPVNDDTVRSTKAKPHNKKPHRPKEKKELIPFSKAAVPEIDTKLEKIIVNRVAAGLVPYKKDTDLIEA